MQLVSDGMTKGKEMKSCYVESAIQKIAERVCDLIDRGIITKERKIVLYGLDTYSFAMRTILSNLGFRVDSYISDNQELLIQYKRHVKAVRARYLNDASALIGICSLEERLEPFAEDVLILNADEDCPVTNIEGWHSRNHVRFFQMYDRKADRFLQSVQGKTKMTLQEVQHVEKDLLRLVDAFCRQKNLRYWVCGGTLLGAMRHRGFIPWDDDVDIFMPWEDYCRFLREFTGTEHCRLVEPSACDRRDYIELFAKVIDGRTIVGEKSGFLRKVHPAGIDVFPLIGLPEDARERLLFFRRYYELEKTIWEDFYAHNGDLRVYNNWYPAQKEFLEKYDFDSSGHVGVLATAYQERDCTTRNVYNTTLRLPFEDIEVNVPGGYAEYLNNLYGEDWSDLPDESKRTSHHNMEAYWL